MYLIFFQYLSYNDIKKQEFNFFNAIFHNVVYIMLVTFVFFFITVTKGNNEIIRKSSEASITVPDVPTYKTLVEMTEDHQSLERFESATGIPNRLLLPKGNEKGTEFRLVVAVTNAEEDINDVSIITMNKYHHYGVRGVQPDRRPFGYPLDRRVPDEHIVNEVSSIKETMVKVYNHDVLIRLPHY